jgi:hypothetical protein
MKNIKALLVLVALFISSIIYAQPPVGGQPGSQQGPPPIPNEQQIKEMVSKLASEVSLTEVQTTSVLKLYTEHFKEIKAKTSGSVKPKREEMDALKVNFEKNVKALLTVEQQKKYEESLKKRQKMHP